MTAVAGISPPSEAARQLARERLDALAKPVGALGRLEDLAAWVCACQGTCPPRPLDRVRAVVPAGDHGVVARGVTSYPREVTGAVLRAMIAGQAGMSVLCRSQGVPLRVLDIGVAADLGDVSPAVTAHKLCSGSGSIDAEPALEVEVVQRALRAGADIFEEELGQGLDVLIVGDLGIGNTTPSAALIASRLGLAAGAVTGPGAGLDPAGMARKTAVVQAALDRVGAVRDPVRRLAELGSADIAVGAGLMVAAARSGVPMLVDGMISAAEALLAEELAPGAAAWFVAGHRSPEPGSGLALEALGLQPILELGLRLGEGTGAITALPVLRSAVTLLREMALLSDLAGS